MFNRRPLLRGRGAHIERGRLWIRQHLATALKCPLMVGVDLPQQSETVNRIRQGGYSEFASLDRALVRIGTNHVSRQDRTLLRWLMSNRPRLVQRA